MTLPAWLAASLAATMASCMCIQCLNCTVEGFADSQRQAVTLGIKASGECDSQFLFTVAVYDALIFVTLLFDTPAWSAPVYHSMSVVRTDDMQGQRVYSSARPFRRVFCNQKPWLFLVVVSVSYMSEKV